MKHVNQLRYLGGGGGGGALAKLLEKDIKNKWRWEWLAERDFQGQQYEEWLKKPDSLGMAFCEACNKTISYKSGGKKAICLHAEDAKPTSSLRIIKSKQLLRKGV